MIDLYGEVVRRVLHPAWEKGVKRRPVLDYLAELEGSERASLAELRGDQHRQLERLLRHAYDNVPHYRGVLDQRGLRPHDFREPSDLAKLPLLTRQDARASVDTRVATAGPRPAITKTTGGTTGEPLVIRYDLGSEHRRQAMRMRGFGWAGYRVGDVSLHYWGAPTKADISRRQLFKQRIDRGIKREHYVDCTPRGDSHKAEVVATLRRLQPRAMMCYAQAGAELARYINREGARDWPDVAVICGAEKVYPDDRAALTEAFGPEVFETYGCREVMLIATECAAHDGLHLSMEHLIVEICDDDGAPVAPGEVGQVVITDLYNYGSPLIRYANGDLAVAMPETPCACGRAHPRLASIEGRKTETLADGDGNPVGGMIFNLMFSPLADEVDQFQAVQHADRSVTLKVVTRGPLSERVLGHVRKNAETYLRGVAIDIQRVDSIPLSKSGKRRVVVVES